MQSEIDRAIEMLNIASRYIRDKYPYGLIYYDEADCDGWCVADDCEGAAEMLKGVKNKHE